jgi:hypothetical protein
MTFPQSLTRACSQGPNRPSLLGVAVRDGRAYAGDGHRLHWTATTLPDGVYTADGTGSPHPASPHWAIYDIITAGQYREIVVPHDLVAQLRTVLRIAPRRDLGCDLQTGRVEVIYRARQRATDPRPLQRVIQPLTIKPYGINVRYLLDALVHAAAGVLHIPKDSLAPLYCGGPTHGALVAPMRL